jgi:hypothetical protein
MPRIDSSAVGGMMLNKVGLATSKTRAMFELMDCHRLTTDERLGFGITAYMEPTLETRWEASPHLGHPPLSL